jgi:PAS domain S-box-containing protein
MGGLDQHTLLRNILEGTSAEVGERFFAALVEHLARATGTRGAWVTEYLPESNRLRALAFWMDGEWIENYEYDIAGTPCELVIEDTRLVHIPDNILELYPGDSDIDRIGAVSYIGVPLQDIDGRILGHLSVLHSEPLPADEDLLAVFRIFAARASAELQRLRVEADVHAREGKLTALVDSAMDAIVELDERLQISRLNPAAEKLFGRSDADLRGRSLTALLKADSADKLRRCADSLGKRPQGQRYLWVAGGLNVRCMEGSAFQAEATLSQFEMEGRRCYTLILRDVEARRIAERRIEALSRETEYLREEIRALGEFDAIIGKSPALLRVLNDVREVADTDAAVLILGETGTGKELIARAIHDASPRRDRALVKVNCAAMPANLVESELFGHEKGAFTGATQKREGRFSLAHGGTIFLDEIGELPLELQAKLLRVLQEGEFEPLGSSTTRKVNVRVIAASNRDLRQAVEEGGFRQDLFYRLNVFPITMPPLRARREDIALLATGFTQRFARRNGRAMQPPTAECIERLKAYDWPGNVRELQNVIERAVITARDGQLNLDRALPDAAPVAKPSHPPEITGAIQTMDDLREMERRNLLRALEAADWKVSGEQGAASMLGIHPSTLSSRMKALGIKRPA